MECEDEEKPKVKKSKSKSSQCEKEPVKKFKTKPPGPPASSVLELPHFLRLIGPKQVKILMNFVPTVFFYSVSSLILITYVSDWKAVLQYLPYYNGKYKVDTPPPPPPPPDDADKPAADED